MIKQLKFVKNEIDFNKNYKEDNASIENTIKMMWDTAAADFLFFIILFTTIMHINNKA